MTLGPEAAADWLAWVETRPPAVAAVAERLPPWQTYRLKTTGQRCRLMQYDEPEDGGPVTVRVYAWYPWTGPIFGHGVFGIDPDDLELWLASDDA